MPTGFLGELSGDWGMSGKIFVSYRRDDSPGSAGRLYDLLEATFGTRNVFFDVDAISPGRDFVEEINIAVDNCDAMVVVIGPRWLSAVDENSKKSRLENPNDFVRLEIEGAISRRIPIFPVCVDGALPINSERELPESIGTLARRQSLRLTTERFHQDAQTLIKTLRKALVEERIRRREEYRQEITAPFSRLTIVLCLILSLWSAYTAAMGMTTLQLPLFSGLLVAFPLSMVFFLASWLGVETARSRQVMRTIFAALTALLTMVILSFFSSLYYFVSLFRIVEGNALLKMLTAFSNGDKISYLPMIISVVQNAFAPMLAFLARFSTAVAPSGVRLLFRLNPLEDTSAMRGLKLLGLSIVRKDNGSLALDLTDREVRQDKDVLLALDWLAAHNLVRSGNSDNETVRIHKVGAKYIRDELNLALGLFPSRRTPRRPLWPS
jgi:hypothetical protein